MELIVGKPVLVNLFSQDSHHLSAVYRKSADLKAQELHLIASDSRAGRGADCQV